MNVKLTSFQIKVLAVGLMIVDHVGAILFPEIFILRMIGRLAFPLFAWLIANGAYHTHNIRRYIIRLFCLAAISQLPYILMIRTVTPQFWDVNVVFTLCLGLVAIALMRKTKNKFLQIFILLGCVAAAYFGRVDYGAVGVLSILAFYYFRSNFKYLFISQFILYTIPCITAAYFYAIHHVLLEGMNVNLVEPIGILSLIFIKWYNGKQGSKIKYFFYVFYPLHLLVIFWIKLIL